ncbi:hypothetical protein BJ138DRAFT_1183398 [Hygrophoropsis aurantiaca]|uniref:Uncharacterized protein n=1 Tax=Hygrophoropsis aurantiaca TaxID=72124 RepID=A0ACB7ZZ08_9AGAM|nr:hypothetical protein BJ138DRAFT_1183398 [Hygrophoropsis aurantiaca]
MRGGRNGISLGRRGGEGGKIGEKMNGKGTKKAGDKKKEWVKKKGLDDDQLEGANTRGDDDEGGANHDEGDSADKDDELNRMHVDSDTACDNDDEPHHSNPNQDPSPAKNTSLSFDSRCLHLPYYYLLVDAFRCYQGYDYQTQPEARHKARLFLADSQSPSQSTITRSSATTPSTHLPHPGTPLPQICAFLERSVHLRVRGEGHAKGNVGNNGDKESASGRKRSSRNARSRLGAEGESLGAEPSQRWRPESGQRAARARKGAMARGSCAGSDERAGRRGADLYAGREDPESSGGIQATAIAIPSAHVENVAYSHAQHPSRDPRPLTNFDHHDHDHDSPSSEDGTNQLSR